MINRVFIIAEAGVNHNGSIDMATKLIDVAAKAGADAVKFQTFKADNLVSKKAPKAEYQTKTTDASESQYEMIKRLELDEKAHEKLLEHCKRHDIEFLSTPFDLKSADMLASDLNIKKIKISSGDITNAPLLLQAAKTGKPVILSTGMSRLSDIEMALGVLAFGYISIDKKPSIKSFKKAYMSEEGQKALKNNVILLHCTTEYPAPYEEVNLKAMDTLRTAFDLPVGLSDHTTGIAVPIAAVARGAVVIEKHFTLDKNLPGPDHEASLEPEELEQMVKSIRHVEKSLGSHLKTPAPSEVKNIKVVRKSLVASRDIKKGEIFTEENLTVKRPGNGVSPMYYWDWLGKAATKDYCKDEVITYE
ncbi:MAG: hypothetical protein PWP31_319 [Clostridia bacterium]|nr:hypothetical protein [Clostridia bacterium]